MATPRVVLVIGPPGSGKTSLIRSFLDGACPAAPASTIGLDQEAGQFKIEPTDKDLSAEMAAALPPCGLDLEVWEMGGRERRELPRGRAIDGLVLCYDATDRSSFLRAAHLLTGHRMDRHMQHVRAERSVGMAPLTKRLPAVLVATKGEGDRPAAVSEDEVRSFVQEKQVQAAFVTSAKQGSSVREVFHGMALAVLQADADHVAEAEAAAVEAARPASEAWSLPCGRPDTISVMTSPRGVRPHEPLRGRGEAAPLVEVLEQHCAPRTLALCMERGLLHRAVHVWLCVPRTGAVLMRKWAPDATKHPGSWGPTCHSEVRCYGGGGDGHASEVSAQAAERSLQEQLGVDASQVGELEHWFSDRASDGMCQELIDVYVAPIEGSGLPPLELQEAEQVDWVFFADVFDVKAGKADNVFHMGQEYRESMLRRARARVVHHDVVAAFGDRGEFGRPPQIASLALRAAVKA